MTEPQVAGAGETSDRERDLGFRYEKGMMLRMLPTSVGGNKPMTNKYSFE